MDTLTRARRSENMRRIRSTGMKPELIVRSLIHRLGFRFRLHAPELPGKPDIVRRRSKQAIFVHGCFWHQHPSEKCLDGRLPKSNTSYWHPKLSRNVERDLLAIRSLKKAGWRVLVIWECETRNIAQLGRRLRQFLHSR
ncbi:MAG: DNA mismatch endonuclease Vsr [Alphaproteobacteria bacterium]|nr:DNA mismatch endonuclease Vsr [Alphaproteobacteria bacterium]